jgi:hypothetical protein
VPYVKSNSVESPRSPPKRVGEPGGRIDLSNLSLEIEQFALAV